ncbi:Proteasome assembly chaperone 1 [Orchesella cincta]|uniref:Proteasome assembly chaperone 1 n=1 Tax=Orchesella cincta TaxID=48709 RepID=A0A1D2NEU5_ORCCI|nr:Proteasome assembly chaperone 1 [Orchesella cincta]
MVATFGEVVYESSRAFADDEEEECEAQTGLSFEVEHTSVAKSLLEKGSPAAGLVFCAFVGKVAVGFGDGFVNNKSGFDLLAEVCMVGQGENVVDIYLNRPKKKVVAQLYYGAKDKNNPVIFALFNTHGVPRFLANEIVSKVTEFIEVSNRILIFHSDTLAYYQSDERCEGKVFYVASSKYSRANIPSTAVPLAPPNVIGGIGAGVLMHGEMMDKPALLLANYGENELVDSISLQPFAAIVKQGAPDPSSFSLSQIFKQLELTISQSLKSNVNPVAISNLYI